MQLAKLDYKFGDDGVFWMTYQDMLSTFNNLHRTRIFDSQWDVVQEWTSVNVAWLTGYLQRKFIVQVEQPGLVVIVLSQASFFFVFLFRLSHVGVLCWGWGSCWFSPWLTGVSCHNSSTADTSAASRASTPSFSISSCRRRARGPETTSVA